jgi:hypothetical protein
MLHRTANVHINDIVQDINERIYPELAVGDRAIRCPQVPAHTSLSTCAVSSDGGIGPVRRAGKRVRR